MSHLLDYRSLFASLLAQRRDFWLANLYGLAATLLFLPIPLLLPLLIDELLLHHPGRLSRTWQTLGIESPGGIVAATLILTLTLRLAAFWFNNRKTYHLLRIVNKSALLLRHRILHHLEHLAFARYESLRSGQVISRSIQDVGVVASFLGQAATTLLTAGLSFVGILAVMFWISWPLALLVLLVNPLFLGFSRIVGRRARRLMRRQNESYAAYQDLLGEVLELFAQVRASNRESTLFALLRGRADEIRRASVEYGYRSATAQASTSLLTASATDLFRALGIAAVVYSQISIGMMLGFLFYLSALLSPMQQLMSLVVGFQSMRPAMERINELLRLEREPRYPREADPFARRRAVSVEVRDLHFRYPSGPPVLRGLSLRAEAGETVALVGPSGAGKSTVAQLLIGLYPPERGVVAYGSVPVERIGLEPLRRHVSLMLQDSLFFNDTIRTNLTLGEEIDDARILAALHAARLDDFVAGLPKGLESRIGRNGIRLSGGQRQRLAIARLILADPQVVIFDESTSALDPRTEADLYRTLREFLRDRTVIIIAHRSTTIRQADRIYILEAGRVRAEGDYRSLRERGLLREDFDAPEEEDAAEV